MGDRKGRGQAARRARGSWRSPEPRNAEGLFRPTPTAVCRGVDPLLVPYGSASPHTNPAFPMLPSKRKLLGWLNCYGYRCSGSLLV